MVTLRAATDHEIAEQWRLLAGSSGDDHGGSGAADHALAGRATGTEDLDIPSGTGDSWPDHEAVGVIAALRLLVELQHGAGGGRHHAGEDVWAHRVAERAGRRWSDAHGSARLMRERLLLLPQVIDAGSGPGEDIAIERSVRVIADHAADEALDRLEQAALVDPLTGAGNRRALHVELTRTLAQMGRFGLRLAVVMVDLDGLKETNDRDGHAAGDRALVSLAGSFASHLRAGDALYRIGGDEFVAVLAGASAADVPALLERVTAGAPPFSWGMATTSDPATRITDLLDLADADLYQRRRAKRSGASLALIAGGGAAAGAGDGTMGVAERARRRTRAASAALVAGLALAGGAAPVLETGALHVALPPEPHAARSGQPPAVAPAEPPATTPATVAPPTSLHPTVPGAPAVTGGTTSRSTSLAGQSGSLVAIRSTTVPTTAPLPPPAPKTSPAPASAPAPAPAPATAPSPGRGTTAPAGGGVVGTVVSTVATDVSTTAGGVGAVVGDLLGRGRSEEPSSGHDRGRSAHADAAPYGLSPRTAQTPQGRPTWWARWHSHSRGR